MDTAAAVTAFALSSLPLDFYFVHAKKKRSILVIRSNQRSRSRKKAKTLETKKLKKKNSPRLS